MSYVQKKHLLLSSVYNLNSSFTKQAAVGAGFNQQSCELTPLVELRTSHPPSIFTLSPEGWIQLKLEFKKIASFFNGCGSLQLLECEEFHIHFTYSFNERRVILVSKKKDDKSRHEFSMCATTFYVLNNISHCVSQRLEELLRLPIEFYRKCILRTITETIISSNKERIETPNANQVKLYVKNYETKLMKRSFKKIMFSGQHFELFFIEFLTFHLNDLCEEIIKILSCTQMIGNTIL